MIDCRRLRGLSLWTVLVCLVLGMSTEARADGTGPSLEDLRRQLVTPGTNEGEWRGILQAVAAGETPTEDLESLLAPVFARDGVLAPQGTAGFPVLAYCMAWVIENPADPDAATPPLLADAMVDRLAGDDGLVAELRRRATRDIATGRKPAWDALLDHAEARLEGATKDLEGIRDAIDVLAHENEERAVGSMRAILEVARRRTGASEDGLGALPESVFLDAFARLLGHRFGSLVDAVRWFQERADVLETWATTPKARTRLILLGQLRAAASRLPDIHQRYAIENGKAAVKRARTASEVMAFLDPKTTPYPSVRAEGWKQAERLQASPDGEWATALTDHVPTEEAPVVLRAIQDVLALPAFAQATGDTKELTDALRTRLIGPFRRTDDAAWRLALARALGILAPAERVAQALALLQTAHREADAPASDLKVYLSLLERYGEMEGAAVTVLTPHWFSATGVARTEVRRQVADALGRARIRESEADAALAGPLLAVLLHGLQADGERPAALATLSLPETVPHETDAQVRRTLLEAMQYYPVPEVLAAVKLARQRATAENAPEMATVHYVLGQLLQRHGYLEVVDLLLEDLGQQGAVDANRARVATLLGSLPAEAPEALRTRVRAALRAAAATENGAATATRTAAFAALTALKDVEALPLLWAASRGNREDASLAQAVDALAGAVAKAGPDHDEALVAFLDAMTKPPAEGAAVDAADVRHAAELARVLFQETGRQAFALWRADHYRARFLDGNLGEDQRRFAGLEAVNVLVRAAQAAPAEGDARASLWTRAYDAALAVTGVFAEQTWYLPLQVAKDSGRKDLARRAVEGDGGDQASPLAAAKERTLDEEGAARRDTLEEALQALLVDGA